MVAENDASGIAPGSNLLEALFKKYAPCLILIDEWVAYLRQIYKVEGLPSGSFDANLSFVQSLTEAVKASPGTLLVASLARVADRGRRRRRSGGAGAPQADLQPRGVLVAPGEPGRKL
jgi:predicted AAA+ superfamily ATPase